MKKKAGFLVLFGAAFALIVSMIGPGCTLDTYGLFNNLPDSGPDCQLLCEEAAAGNAGSPDAAAPDAAAPDATPDTDVPDVCDCGTGGSGGTSGAGGTGGVAGQGGTSGNGGAAGQGGVAGSGGVAGAGGVAGQGGTAGSAGTAGQGGAAGSGGTGGAGGALPNCAVAGDPGTVDNIVAQGVTATGVLLHYNDGTEAYFTATPTTQTFTGKPMPGQMVLAGQDGFQFILKNAASLMPKPWYKASNFPNAECGGVNGFQSQACESVVAKSFRCQYSPYNESVGCPAVTVNFAAQATASSDSEAGTGWGIILVDLTCP